MALTKEKFIETIKHGKAPDIAIRFKKKPDVGRWPDEHYYRVSGWYKMVSPETLRKKDDWINDILLDSAHKRDGKLLMRCTREDATHVSGSGVGGCIVAVEDIICEGYVNWDKETIDRERERALKSVGEYID
jgi:hypothetical protein